MGIDSGWYRINEVERRSEVSRRTVHIYLEQGLLHPPRRTGRNMAYHDDVHLAALSYIRAARDTGMPRLAIKGHRATAVNDITSQLKVGKGTFYFWQYLPALGVTLSAAERRDAVSTLILSGIQSG